MEPPNVFQGMRINNFYKYILYLSGIIFILSLFFDVKGISVDIVRHASFTFVVTGLIIWIGEDIFQSISEYYSHLDELDRLSERKAETIAKTITVLWYIFIIITLIIGGIIAF